jgi:hypothetical protein
MINPVTTATVKVTAMSDSIGPKSSSNCGFFEISLGTGNPGATVGLAGGGGAGGADERGAACGAVAIRVGADTGRTGADGGGGGGAENTMVGAMAGGVGGSDIGGRFPLLSALREPGSTEFTEPTDGPTGSVSTGSRQNIA